MITAPAAVRNALSWNSAGSITGQETLDEWRDEAGKRITLRSLREPFRGFGYLIEVKTERSGKVSHLLALHRSADLVVLSVKEGLRDLRAELRRARRSARSHRKAQHRGPAAQPLPITDPASTTPGTVDTPAEAS